MDIDKFNLKTKSVLYWERITGAQSICLIYIYLPFLILVFSKSTFSFKNFVYCQIILNIKNLRSLIIFS